MSDDDFPCLRDWILKITGVEPILGVALGNIGWGNYGREDIPDYDEQPKGKLISWNDAQQYLNYKFHDGFGAPGCNSIYVWTESKVLFVVQYDGSTRMHYVPRHPCDVMPEMPGG